MISTTDILFASRSLLLRLSRRRTPVGHIGAKQTSIGVLCDIAVRHHECRIYSTVRFSHRYFTMAWNKPFVRVLPFKVFRYEDTDHGMPLQESSEEVTRLIGKLIRSPEVFRPDKQGK